VYSSYTRIWTTKIMRMNAESKKKNFGPTSACLVSFSFTRSFFWSVSLTPTEIDFSVLVPDDQARNYVKRGGSQEPTSPEKEAQELREATTLMVFYTSPGPSPKEPPASNVEDKFVEEVPFGQPGDHIKVRKHHIHSLLRASSQG
jgi:hypothetical protein